MRADFNKIKAHVFQKLEENLPGYLTYHSVEHTKYVLEKVIYISSKENVSKADLFLLKVAALYHDIGFTVTHLDHEAVGCSIARIELSVFNFSEKEIDIICGMIKATKIPQQPKTHLEKILADADLEYLGTKHFEVVSNYLYEEIKHFNPYLTLKEWNEIQIKFIQKHHYFTKFCKHYKAHRKIKNLEKLIY